MEHSLNFLIESKVPFLEGLLEPFGNVCYADPDDITPGLVRNMDAMVIRTRTRCNASLLTSSRCSFIATATIGTDHIDLPWCAAHGISVANAPGCNAPAVAQYVFGSIAAIDSRLLSGNTTLGIVGAGHVGSIVARWGRALGMRVLLCDPPRFRDGDAECNATLDDIARESDIITFHTPLSHDGADATYHLASDTFFKSLRHKPVLINAARGGVIDSAALTDALDAGIVRHAAIDCWENEPHISPELLARAAVATPHIAGYSREGKWRASRMSLDALCNHFGLPHLTLREPGPAADTATVTPSAIAASYNPLLSDTPALKNAPESFETLRNTYRLRREL